MLRQLHREAIAVARCTVARLMRDLDLRGVVRGWRVKTTTPVATLPYPTNRVNRVFQAPHPNAMWVADLSFVATWAGFVYVAFVVDAYARRIRGWRVSNSLRTDLALDALEQDLYDRAVDPRDTLVHDGDRGVQILSFRYTERLAEAGIEPSVGRLAIRSTTLCQSPLSSCTRQGSSVDESSREDWRRWISHRSTGWIGSSADGCSSRSRTGPRLRSKRRTIPKERTRRWPRDPRKAVSGNPGAVQDVRDAITWTQPMQATPLAGKK